MIEARVVQALDALGVPYELMEIDPAFADTAACCEKYGLPLASAGNTIVVASKKEPKQFGACVVKATTRLDVNHAVRALLGASKVSFASAEGTQALTGMMLGGVTVFALPSDLPIYVDDKLMPVVEDQDRAGGLPADSERDDRPRPRPRRRPLAGTPSSPG